MIIINLSKVLLELLIGWLAWAGEVPWWWPVAFALWEVSIRYVVWLPGRRAAYEAELKDQAKAYLQMPSEKTTKGWN